MPAAAPSHQPSSRAQADFWHPTGPGPGVTSGMRYAYIRDPEGNLIELIETSHADSS